MSPLVSVIFPCYNSESYLKYSLESIINQNYKQLEIICINDGSTDRTFEILNEYKKKDSRIIIINNEKNIGLIASLNNALSKVSGEYFARMDADDYSTFDRISKQVKFMQSSPEIDIVSSAYNYFYLDGQKREYIAPIAFKPKSLKFLSLFCTPLTHASVLGKSSLIHNGLYQYHKDYPYAEDFELFSRLAWNNIKMSTISESLYWVRLHSNSVSVKYNSIQFQTNLNIIKRNIYNYINAPLILDDALSALLACRVNSVISLEQIKTAFSIYDGCINIVKNEMNINEMKEIKDYLLSHKFNILLQVNKKRFVILGFKNVPFFVRSLFLLNIKQIPLIFIKQVLKLKNINCNFKL